jgi:hypothetical protein
MAEPTQVENKVPEQPRFPSPIRPPQTDKPEADQLAGPLEPERRVRRVRPEGPFVKYVGTGTNRLIQPHHWKQKLQDKVHDPDATHDWNVDNNFCIPVKEFSDHQLDYLLVDDRQDNGAHSFLEVDYDDNDQLVQVSQLHK